MKFNRHVILTSGILAGLVLGLIFGEVLLRVLDESRHGAAAEALSFLGDITFMSWLKMILVPLVASSVIVGVASIDPANLGRVGGWTVFYYMSTMVIAVLLGVTLVTTIAPGKGLDANWREQQVSRYGERAETAQAAAESEGLSGARGVIAAVWTSARRIITQMIPTNPIGAAARGDILPVIVFSLIFGIVLSVLGPRAQPLLGFFNALFLAVMKLVEWILWLAPVGVFFLAAYSVIVVEGVANLLGPLAGYAFVVIVGLLIHGLGILPLILWVFGRTHPYRYMHQMRAALMTAFGTDSSSATLPVTIESAEKFGGVSKKSAGFVLPLGATINMDGTALYEAVAVVFLFQCYGIPLGPVELAIIVVTATLAAIGAAGIPSAGLVTMVIVIEAVNNSLGDAVPALPLAAAGIIIGIDRFLDMCRTTVNVWGDAVGAKIMTRIAPDEVG